MRISRVVMLPLLFGALLLGWPNLHNVDGRSTIDVSGTFEACSVRVMSDVPGQVQSVLVREGERVNSGQVVVQIDQGTLQEQLREAEARLEAAEANLADVRAQPLPGAVKRAEAQVAQAEAMLRGAQAKADAARAAEQHPVVLDNAIQQAQAQLHLLAQELEGAQAQEKMAQVSRDRYQFDLSDQGKTQYAVGQKQVLAAEAKRRSIEAEMAGTRRLVATLRAIRGKPLSLQAQLHRAEGQLAVAMAQVAAATAGLHLAQAPARPEALTAARAQVAQAQIAVDLLRERQRHYSLRAPAAGMVTQRLIEPGELAQPGVPLLVVSDLTTLDLTVYVPEPQLGLVFLGQQAEVSVDSYPDRVFSGTVVWIAQEAEFTPKNVQTKEDRVQTVFRTKVRVANPDGLLKAGMLADARLLPVRP